MDAKQQQQERQHARAVEHVRGGVEVGRLVLGADIGTRGRTGAPALLLMALSSAPLHANNMHVRNWLLIFVAFDESVIVRCGWPSERKGGSGACAGTTIMLCGMSRRGRSFEDTD